MSWTHTRAKLAATKRHHPDADVDDLRRNLRAELLGEYIRRTVDAAPPLTAEQRLELSLLLRPSGAAEAELASLRGTV